MTEVKKPASFDWLALWILFSAWASLSGWSLSVFGWLNPVGIVASFAVFLACIFLFRSPLLGGNPLGSWRKLRSRFISARRVTPKLWLALATISLIGAIAYTPDNYDYLTYRFPRVLYWSWDQGWSWIPTVNPRINYSGTGFEWLMVSLFVLFKTDRLFFLINFIPFLLLPGLIFSVFSHLGVSKRISWWWMWVFPCGYCFILQAASVGNDTFATVYLLGSLYYLFQMKESPSVRNLPLSCVAIALLTGAKASNLPLVLPWVALAFYQRNYLLGKCRPGVMALFLIIAAGASFLPIALLNIYFTGDFAGDPHNIGKMKIANPVSGFVGNSLQLAKDNLSPPIFPRAIDWQPFLPSSLKEDLQRDFPRLDLHTGELQIEEDAGLGLGCVLFAGAFLVAGIRARMSGLNRGLARNRLGIAVVSAGTIAWLAYMSKMGSEATSRLIASYYPLLIVGILVFVAMDGTMTRRRWLRWTGYLAMLSALPVLILCPARPLFPVQTISGLLTRNHAPAKIVERFDNVYRVYALRADAFKELLESLPPGERALGFLQAGNDSEVSLWRPFGTRKVIEVSPTDSLQQIKAEGISYVAVSEDALTIRYQTTLSELLTKWSGTEVDQKNVSLFARRGPETWYLIKL